LDVDDADERKNRNDDNNRVEVVEGDEEQSAALENYLNFIYWSFFFEKIIRLKSKKFKISLIF
jgi:hypothetical protein